MVRIKPTIKTIQILNEFPLHNARFDKGVRRGLYRAGQIVQRDIKEGIKNPPKTGRIYSYRGRKHQASAPGEYAANRSGKLRRSIDFTVEGSNRLIVGSPFDYAKYLEDGTVNMLSRPSFELSVNRTAYAVLNALKCAVDVEMKRG